MIRSLLGGEAAEPCAARHPGAVPPPSGAVEKTLLVPLWARARESRRPFPILEDPAAEQLLSRIAFDPTELDAGASASQLGCCVRGALVDRWVREFLTRHPAGTIVEAGCGLNCRFDRADNGQATWLSFDLPEVIALRRRLLPPRPRSIELAASLLDPSWVEHVRRHTPAPWFLVSEGVLMYLTSAEARAAVCRAAEGLPGGWFAYDVMTPIVLRLQALHDAMRHFEAPFIGSVPDPSEVASWSPSLRLLHSESFFELLFAHGGRLPPWMRLVGPALARLWPRIHRVYTINLAQFSRPPA